MRAFRENVCAETYVTSVFYLSDNSGTKMLAIRLYISTLTILFMSLVIASRGLGILEAIVITCAIVYLIIDIKIELNTLKGELHLLEQLEERISVYLR